MPRISVIMGVYNCPKKKILFRAVDSVLNQTFGDFEFLICDDGSTNDTLKWLREKAQTDKRIVVLENGRNRGLAVALNHCLKRAKGEFIARQDADDYSANTRFQTQVDFLTQHRNIDFVGTASFVYDKDGPFGEWHRPAYPSKRDFLFNSPFIHGTTMFRREVFDRCGGYRLVGKCHKYEDYEFFMRAYASGFQGANIDRLLYTFYSEVHKNRVPTAMRLDEYHVRKEGFARLGLLPKAMPYVWKPLVLALIPNALLNWLKDFKKNNLMHKYSVMLKLYKVLVNRNSYIKLKYERFVNTHKKLHRQFPVISWCYLLKLNLESLFMHRSERDQENAKGLKGRESAAGGSAQELARKLSGHEIVSFDIFDTLIFRPFAVPSDMFYMVGEALGYPDFKTIRVEAEKSLRRQKGAESVTLREIYDFLAQHTGIDAETGMNTELRVEMDLCSANPYLKEVYNLLRANGQRIIIVSDMYLPADFLAKMLRANGFDGFEKIYISCEIHAEKHDGRLYEYVKKDLRTTDIIHVGDNFVSDVSNARKHGLSAIEYKNVNEEGNIYRPKDMSPIIGSAYSGIVNRRLYRADRSYSSAYEYGFKYGGLLVLGFCGYIHKIARERAPQKILFFSRDGYIVREIYSKLYPEEKTEYVYWSRSAAAKLGADLFRDNFLKKFVTQKRNHGMSLYDIFSAIGIADWDFPFNLNDELTTRNAEIVEDYLLENWDRLMAEYDGMDQAARQYFGEILKDCKSVLTVDCGWAGSGNIILEQIVNRKWNMHCAFTGVLAGSNSFNQHDADSSETFILDKKMRVFCFSSTVNRDKYKAHKPALNYNIYFEMLFSAPEPSFREFRLDSDGKYAFVFDTTVENKAYIEAIQKGERDFIYEYIYTFRKYPFMRNISGSDAYTPFMEALEHSKKYIDKMFAECVFDETTSGRKNRIK